jgi:prophage regulatory protein
MSERLLRLPAVLEATGLSRSTLYRLAKAGDFPKSIKLRGCRAPFWPQSAVHSWIRVQLEVAEDATATASNRNRIIGGPST